MIRYRVLDILKLGVLALLAVLFIFPLYWLVISSFKTPLELSQIPPVFFLTHMNFSNYTTVWGQLNFAVGFRNSIFVTGVVTVLILLFSSMGGYVLAKKELIGKRWIMLVIISTMVVPPTVLLVPLFYIISAIGLYDSLWGIIIPFSVTAFGLFFMKQYIEEVPNELLEASRIDSCGEYRIFFSIVLPLIKPGLAALATIEMVNNWNSFTVPLVVLRSPDLKTIPLKVAELVTATDVPLWTLVLAGNVLAVMPIVFIYLFLQKWFIHGVMDGAVKG